MAFMIQANDGLKGMRGGVEGWRGRDRGSVNRIDFKCVENLLRAGGAIVAGAHGGFSVARKRRKIG